MQRKFLFLLTGLAFISFIHWNCTKIDSTTLGADLIPAVDNVLTFADTFDIDAVREQNIDTTRLSRSETHVLGNIKNDPIFGKTTADIFLELKPTFFPFHFGNANDTIDPGKKPSTHFDSVFLCLSFNGFYGDSTKMQHFKVYQLNENTGNFTDTVAHLLNFQPDQPYQGNLLGEQSVFVPELRNYTFLNTSKKDSVTRQIRIKLSNTFLATLASGDSTKDKPNNFFQNDSLFQERFRGFAVTAEGNEGNGLTYISLTDANTRLEVHYVASNANVLDTAYTSFPLSIGTYSNVTASATANNIIRDTSSAEFPNSPDPTALYIQSAPGSAISLTIPELTSLSNRIVHRAEIFIEQIPGTPGNAVFTAPAFLYLDLIDDTGAVKKYKPLYYDLSPNEFYSPDHSTSFFPSEIDQNYYGGFLRTKTDGLGTRSFYTFNLTRYIQQLATNGGTNYKLRVYAPYNLSYNGLNLNYKNNLALGRVKIGNGANPNFRLRMRMVWSKI